MRLLSSVFKSKKGLSKEVNQKRERRCTETPRGFREEASCNEICMRSQKEEALSLPISKEEEWIILDLLIDLLCPLSLKKVRGITMKKRDAKKILKGFKMKRKDYTLPIITNQGE